MSKNTTVLYTVTETRLKTQIDHKGLHDNPNIMSYHIHLGQSDIMQDVFSLSALKKNHCATTNDSVGESFLNTVRDTVLLAAHNDVHRIVFSVWKNTKVSTDHFFTTKELFNANNNDVDLHETLVKFIKNFVLE